MGLVGAVAAGAAAGLGLWLVVAGATGARLRSGPPRWSSAARARLGRRTVAAVALGLAVLLVTRWVALSVGLGLLVVAWGPLFGGGRAASRAVTRLEALAVWTEAVRDLTASGIALAQALPAAAASAPPAVAEPVARLADRLRVREPVESALARFADELDDPAGDLVVAALTLNARVQGGQLRQVLTALTRSIRAELEVRRRVEAERRSTRRGAAAVAGITVVMAVGLFTLNRAYVQPFDSPTGQVVLGVVVALFASGFWALSRLSAFQTAGRFLAPAAGRSRPAAQPVRPRSAPVGAGSVLAASEVRPSGAPSGWRPVQPAPRGPGAAG